LTNADYLWIISAVKRLKVPVKDVARRTRLTAKTIYNYLDRDTAGVAKLRGRGRPPSLDEEAVAAVRKEVEDLDRSHGDKDTAAIKAIVLKHQKLTAQRYGRTPPTRVTHDTWVYAVEKCNLKGVGGQDKTAARAVEETSPMSFVSTLTAFYYVSTEIKQRELMVNYDATAVCIGGMTSSKRILWVLKDRGSTRPVSAPPTQETKGCCTVKWWAVSNAAGGVGPLVLHLEWPELPDADLAIYPVEGLTTSTDLTVEGYVVFTKTRHGNAALFEWFLTKIVGDWTVKTRTSFGRKGLTKAAVLADGESEQMLSTVSPAVTKFYRDNSLVAIKSHPSATAVAQAWDADKAFSAFKASCKRFALTGVDNEGLKNVLQNGPFMREGNSSPYWTTARCNFGVEAILIVHAAICSAVDRDLVKRSWATIGLRDLAGNFDLEQVARQHSFELTAQEHVLLSEDVVGASRAWAKRGKLTDAELVTHYRWLRIPTISALIPQRNQPRDHLCLTQQRCVLPQHPSVQPAEAARAAQLHAQAKLRRTANRQKERVRLAKEAKGARKRKNQVAADDAGVRQSKRKRLQNGDYGRDAFVHPDVALRDGQ
jgi:hypothetical protein